MAPVYRGSYCRLVLKLFGFGIFYAVGSDRVMVGAILDLRQNPESIERRLSS